MTVTILYFCLQTVYYNIFKVFISVYSVTQNAGDATEFWKEALHGIAASAPRLLLLAALPAAAVILMCRYGFIAVGLSGASAGEPYRIPTPLIRAALISFSMMLYAFMVYSLIFSGTGPNTPYDLYHKDFVLDLSVEKLGLITSAGLDVKNTLFSSNDGTDIYETDNMNLSDLNGFPSKEPASTPVPTLSPTPEPTRRPEVSPTPTPVPSPTPTPIDTSPNVLDIDFASLAEQEKNKEIKSLHEYFATSEPTKKNEYTGMFKGYNFIYLTCEAYSPWAVDENVTPTLYKLTHSGFVFTNYYNPVWYTSTSDGEYVECVGLLPYNTNSFKRSKDNALPFCFGWQFLKLGYTCRAYHDHSYTYYGRDETHPNMGYVYKAKRKGLKITDTWPESDLEMMELTIPEFINDEHFHVYYMTVSGHLEYGFNDNFIARKNKDAVASLPYGEEGRAYIACHVELDKALEYLIEELDKAGKLDNTVIAFGADHYPYGLSDDSIDELAGEHVERNFELHRNNFVIWNSKIEEPIIIDKYSSSIDMMPTLSNLFGLEYDSRLFPGSDILSDAPALVIFGNQSFITDICKYNSKTHEVTMLADVELPEGYIDNVSKIVKNKFAISKNILLNDYYRYILDYIPDVVTTVPSSYD
ncbi:MAG: LTA synthase family protein, partial [Lachnospiraceae bacterium]|nr:LTA synthase family protein [Lachnospiraceae bacterium]